MVQHESISFLRGWPALSLLPVNDLRAASEATFNDEHIAGPGLCYGPDPGYEPLRRALSTWLSQYYKTSTPLDWNRFIITGGASQNLACMLQVFTDPVYTQSMFIVAPSYMMAFRIFEDNGLGDKMIAIPEDEQGVDLDYFKSQLALREELARRNTTIEPLKPKRSYSKYYRHVLYCVPTFSNPSSKVMSLSRRKELVQLAREHDILIVSDDVYDFLHWRTSVAEGRYPSTSAQSQEPDTALVPRFVDIDRDLDGGDERFGNAVSNGSFSKICGPGVRCGWTESCSGFAYGLSQVGSTYSGGAPSQLTSTYMCKWIETQGLQRHLSEKLLPNYQRRHAKMVNAIRMFLVPFGVTLDVDGNIAGGFFIWCRLPAGVMAREFCQRCNSESSVLVPPGDIFQVPGSSHPDLAGHIRLCFSWVDEESLVIGVQRMGKVLENMVSETVRGSNQTTSVAFERHF